MHSFDWLRDVSDQLAQGRRQHRLRSSRRARQRLFLIPLRLESLEPRVLLAADFGDAPAPYPTLVSEGGAQHNATGPRLGGARDSDGDGIHSAAADADGADDDGVTFGTLRVGLLGATASVTAQGGPARLDAWIDFNADGNWGGPGEQIFASRSVLVGNNVLKFDVPSWASEGATFARFRLSTAGGLGPAGPAADGEVEDYALNILRPRPSSGEFEPHSAISTSADAPYAVCAADLDGDGDLDVLSASYLDDTIAWYENNGSETFAARTIWADADAPYAVFVADLDGDGDNDVLSASRNDDTIAWYQNDGTGNFTRKTISTTTDGAKAVSAADIDGDGDLDVLSASCYDDTIAWHENDGNGTFSPHVISSLADGTRTVNAVDLDGDGDMDVLSAYRYEAKIAWYENDGNENFVARTVSTDDTANSVVAADVDRDGDMDVLTASSGISQVAWHENDGQQNFTIHGVFSGGQGSYSASAADLDGDGDVDFLAADYNSNRVVWFENDGAENFAVQTLSSASQGPFSVVTADVDSDGDLDVLSASSYDDKIAWYENVLRATFQAQTITAVADGARSTLAIDLDDDGDTDVLSASSSDDRIAWYENDGGQTFTTHTISSSADEACAVFAADLDGDGDLDVLSASRGDDTIAWYENDGSQNFAAHAISTAADDAYAVIAADVDGDGDMDVLSASRNDDKIAWYENDGSQGFTERIISTADEGALSVEVGDVDGDADLDVLSANGLNEVHWYENDGSENFTVHLVTFEAYVACSIATADVDMDGDLDLLSAAIVGGIAWYENDGDGNFSPHTISAVPDGARSVLAADLDGDGDVDILSAACNGPDPYANTSRIAWYENDGNQNFTSHTISNAAEGSRDVFAADVDADGDLDVLSASYLDDEICWHENKRFDFGDAPGPYPTLLAENGAQHGGAGPWLGATRDSEADGRHSNAADGDGADEDGVSFGALQVGASHANVTVHVQGGTGRLDAWIDFDGDGSWDGAGEQVFAAQLVTSGDNHLSLSVPSWAQPGTTLGRFRLSTKGGLGVVGAAADGEVEDYRIQIGPPAVGSGVFGAQVTIATTADGAMAASAADLDGDGDADVVSASRNDDRIAWWENDGSQGFTGHTIATTADGPYSVAVVDVDGDGDLDVLSASFSDDEIAWYENDGSQTFTTHTISNTADGAVAVAAGDMDGDGDLDVLSASTLDDKIAWYENDGNQAFTARTITTAANGAFAVTAADIDRDGDLDVLSASSLDDKIAWYENQRDRSFVLHLISNSADGTRSVVAADMDRDGDLDILSASLGDDQIAWYENDGNQSFSLHSISTAANGAWSVAAADMDGDGDLDVLSTSIYNHTIAWYENGTGQSFTTRIVSSAAGSPRSLLAADMDGDGDLDVLSASPSDDRLIWYAQDARPVLAANTGATASEGAKAFLNAVRLSVSDTDNTPVQLVYEVTTLPKRGQLELSTAPGIAITSFTQAQVDANQIRYQHDGSETVSDSFAFMVSDGAGGGIGPATFNLTITPASGAPVLNTALNPALTAINEDATAPGSTLVSNLISGAVTDPDVGALRGIAVTSASNFNGTWQYSLNNGTTWTGMGTPSSSAARLLPSSARVRFLPKLNFNGTVQISYRAWDQTAGVAGGTLMVSGNRGGAKTLSFALETAKLTVKPVNDKPVLGGISGSVGYVHDAPAFVLAGSATVTDVDSSDFSGGRLRVRITDGTSSTNRLAIGSGFTVDAQGNVKQGTTTIGKRVANGFGTNELVITFNANATKAIVQQLVRAITFKTASGAAGQHKVVFTVSDGDGGLSAEVSRTVNVS